MTQNERQNQYRCNNAACEKGRETMMCSRCKIVEYCSHVCQRVDWFFHKHVCHLSPSARLRGLCTFLSRSNSRYENLSYTRMAVFKKDGPKLFHLSAFRCDYTNFHDYSCAVCARDDTMSPTIRCKKTVHFAERDWTYFRCTVCVKEGRVLCPFKLDNTTDCAIAHREAVFIRVMLFTQVMALGNDIMGLITSLCIETGACPHCGAAVYNKEALPTIFYTTTQQSSGFNKC